MDNNDFEIAYRQKLLETFRFTISFFESHNLRWWACGGTMLGAIRHHDIIPWDDDIDVIMPREDYNRLLEVAIDLNESHYSLVTPRDNDYYLTSAKIYDNKTTLIESKRYPSAIGVFVDIFPLDQFDYSFKEYCRMFKRYDRIAKRLKLGMARYSFSEAVRDLKNRHLGALYFGLQSLLYPFRRRNIYRKEFLEIEQMFNDGSGRHIASPTGAYGTREFFDSSWFLETIEVPFNVFSVKVPKGYDGYLTVMYGDYMELPPESKRFSHHDHFFVDLGLDNGMHMNNEEL